MTGKPDDLYVFKVAPLRNVAMTAPYFHDGSVAMLDEAVRVMARLQLDRELSDGDVADLVAFLRSLTGALPSSFAAAPVLPPAPFDAETGDGQARRSTPDHLAEKAEHQPLTCTALPGKIIQGPHCAPRAP